MLTQPTCFTPKDIVQASDFIQNGNLLAYPTEAVWGIGCDPFNEKAVRQILTIKNRPIEKGMIVIAPTIDSIHEFLCPLPIACQQAIISSWHYTSEKAFLPSQAITWLFPLPTHLTKKIPTWVTGERNSLAIRLIAHPEIKQLCQSLISSINPYGFLISTSCNPAGELPAQNYQQAHAYFGTEIGYFLDDTLHFTQPSQIRHALTGELVRE